MRGVFFGPLNLLTLLDMKKLILSCALAAALGSQAQVVCIVQQPGALAGSYDMTWADPGSGWGTADLNIPANSVTGTAIFGLDSTPADSLGCDSLLNGSEVAGKIAVVYRGTCNFSLKALHAQYAGAIACVIINNSGAPVGMGAGTYGADVTIPTVMISTDAGALLRDEILAGNVIMYIGAINGAYPTNLSIYKQDVLMAKASSVPKQICGDASEFSVELGTWVHNYGLTAQTGVTLTGDVSLGGSSVYNQVSAPQDIPVGDSVFFTLPTFSQSTYGGLYTVSYTAGSGAVDDYLTDNVFSSYLLIDSMYSLGALDEATELTDQAEFFQPSGMAADGTFASCIHFQDANASRLGAVGMYVSASTQATDSLDGQLIEVFAYQWNDDFTGLSDANLAFSDLQEVATGDFSYLDNSLSHENVYVPFNQAFALENDVRYLFCLRSYNSRIFHGYDNKLNYDENWTLNDQPTSPIDNDGTWNEVGFGSDVTSAIDVRMIDASMVGVAENAAAQEAPAYPNPASDLLRIPVNGLHGTADLNIVDANGRVVSTQRVNTRGGVMLVDVNNVANGSYLFDLRFNDGSKRSFTVVVKK